MRSIIFNYNNYKSIYRDTYKIYLQYNNKKSLIDNEKEKIFFHEAIHCILEHLGYDKLSNDEKLVHQMASAIHQIIKTAK